VLRDQVLEDWELVALWSAVASDNHEFAELGACVPGQVWR
jgi:hypothetical protein